MEVVAVSVQYNSTWRYSGNQLKRWRMKANVSREELAAASNYSPDTIKAMEQGVRMPTARVLDVADGLCGAAGLLSAAKDYVKAEKFPPRAQDFMEYEQQAISLWWYEVALVPGLLQTETYARDLIGNRCPPLDEETVDERVAARVERQALLVRTPPVACSFVLYEAVLRGPHVGKEQLLHLLEVGRRGNVSVQVLPFDRAIPSALLGAMVLLETSERERYAFSEGQLASQLTSEPEVVGVYTERISMLRAEALSAAESVRFIERMVGEQ
ncbi:transcriptional regulator [Streptomyces venezuelae]|uniref:Transcriptional regulator n=1 Tax=Streptomyces venezuelae TaxID=54571 RepID=A0A5P2CTA1_STRVZ|nr:helix-turn-helix transcriptional regulator [Streptomyces venezuelae]QES46085.1 transcriptional regulator [Streptomyces venezuelae]